MKGQERETAERRQPKAIVSMMIAVSVFALGCIQLLSTVHTYVANLNELNANKATEARLIAQKADLENDIARWGDKAYVVAQARDRLGFVFPNEKSVRVLHPEAVTGGETNKDSADAKAGQTGQDTVKQPWYEEMAYSFKEADDKPLDQDTAETKDATGSQSADGNGSADRRTADDQHAADGNQGQDDNRDADAQTSDAQTNDGQNGQNNGEEPQQ